MNVALAILCLAAFAIVTVLVSWLVAAALPIVDRVATFISPRHRVRLWLSLAALPAVAGALAVTASFLPALGIGHDHCVGHAVQHPHLCPHHTGEAPGLVLLFIAGLMTLRVVHAIVELLSGLRLSRDTSASLAQASEGYNGVLIFPEDAPRAFVLGALRPQVHVSSGLVAMGPRVLEPALAHERVHARHRDLLWRALCPLLAVGHLPGATLALRERLSAAQEIAADDEAGEALPGGRLRIAEALLTLANLNLVPPATVSFTHGDLAARVRALLEDRPTPPAWRAHLLLAGAMALPVGLGASHDLIHHGLETLLGFLS